MDARSPFSIVQRQNERPQAQTTSGSKVETGTSTKTSDFELPNINIPQISSLTQNATDTGRGGGSLRSIDQKFQVNPNNGTSSITVPLPCTPARSKFYPELTLSYNSGSGNGSFGIGWQLSLESITRKTSRQIPSYSTNDVFILSGADDLVPVPSRDSLPLTYNGYSIQQFRPRVERDSIRIELWSHEAFPDDSYWRTISAANVTKIYGRTDQSRIFDVSDTGRKRVFSWLLCESYDAMGNAIEFTYKSEDPQGVYDGYAVWKTCEETRSPEARTRFRYLKKVSYGNREPCRDLDSWSLIPPSTPKNWLFQLVFDYGEHSADAPSLEETGVWSLREDSFSTYRSGFEIRQYRLCHRVLMFHHFPEELGVDNYLVSSTSFKYLQSASGSLLTSVVRTGFLFDSKGHMQSENVAPCTFHYTMPCPLETLKVDQKKPSSLQMLPNPGVQSQTRWIDLDGEGLPGVLVELGRSWYYQPCSIGLDLEQNDGDDDSNDQESSLVAEDFGPIRQLSIVPNVRHLAMHSFQDLDGSGRQSLVMTDVQGRLHGFYECSGQEDGVSFRPFRSSLTRDVRGSEILNIDLTGDGLNDILFAADEAGGIVWHENLGKSGYGLENRTRITETYPQLLSRSNTQATFLADMTGDGLTALVQISSSRISYWPNLGYGRFGSEIVMGNAPCLVHDGQFDLTRVHLLDLDGSGSADLIYLLADGGLMAYTNLCGNEWDNGTLVSSCPVIRNPGSVFTLDLLGKGTSCLCWIAPDGGGNGSELAIFYLDFSPIAKPYLMDSLSNGIGLTTSIKYSSSTSFYVHDERVGRPWRTKLPFPVHTVKQVVEKDEIDLTTRNTKYRYHDGYYDIHEREFCGFAMVESWETEKFAFDTGKLHRKPTCHTKMWYHTGARELVYPLTDTFGEPHTMPKLPDNLVATEERDLFRALKGVPLRTEVYGQDGSLQADIPFTVSETSYEVVPLRRFNSKECPGVYRVQQREIMSFLYERCAENPRIKHDLVLKRNCFGDAITSLSVAYGRRGAAGGESIHEAQRVSDIVLTEIEYTNSVMTIDDFYKPAMARRRQYRITGLDLDGIFSFEDLQEQDFTGFKSYSWSAGDGDFIGTTSTKHDKLMVLTSEARVYFWDKSLEKRLPLGALEPYSVIDQTYTLVCTKDQQDAIYDQDERRTVDGSLGSPVAESGLIDLDGDKSWWVPSSCTRFTDGKELANELSTARKYFFSPSVIIDPFGNRSTVKMDPYLLLPMEATDAYGSTAVAVNDYRTMQTKSMTDINLNQTEVAIDILGEVSAVARMGKPQESLGDNLSGLHTVTGSDIRAFITRPSQDTARKWLDQAGRMRICCRERLRIPELSQSQLPLFSIDLVRSSHTSEDQANQQYSTNDVLVSITYYNGRGKAVQTVTSRRWENNSAEWQHSSASVLDAKGNLLRASQPFLSDKHEYLRPDCNALPATFNLHDALGQTVGVLHPNHTWSKTCRSSWSVQTWDVGDTVLVPDPKLDPDIGNYFATLNPSHYLPSWYQLRVSGNILERATAEQSKLYANNPAVAFLDCLGRPVQVVISDGPKKHSTSFHYDLLGNKCAEIDSLGRVVEQSKYDLAGKKIRIDNMETGTRFIYLDCVGAEIFDRQVTAKSSKRYVYDKLRRPLETWTLDDNNTSEILWSKIVYGETELDPTYKNLKGRVVHSHDQSGVQSNIQYDFKGNCVVSSIQLATEYKQTLDWANHVSLDESIYRTFRRFDALDRPCHSVDALGKVTRRQYNLHGGLAKIDSSEQSPAMVDIANMSATDNKEWSAQIANVTYAADGKPIRIDYGNTAHTEFTYNDETRLVIRKKSWRDDGKILEDITYSHDCMGRITRVENAAEQDVYFRNQKTTPIREYSYDTFGRIVKCIGREMVDPVTGGSRSLRPLGTSTTSPVGHDTSTLPADGQRLVRYFESYEYDDADNIVRLRHEFDDAKIAGVTRTYHYQEPSLIEPSKKGNKLSYTQVGGVIEKYGYEEDPSGKIGCVTSMPGYSMLGWNSEQRLRCSARQAVNGGTPETTWYVYNSSGARIRKITERQLTVGDNTTTFRRLKETLYLDSAEIFRRYNGDLGKHAVRHETQSSYIVAEPGSTNHGPIATFERNLPLQTDAETGEHPDLVRYALSHGLEVDDQARVVSYEEYSAFGNSTMIVCKRGVEAPSRYRFASYTRDTETGLYLCGARYYASWLGRWISPDPIGTADGLNSYVYASNDPVNSLDTEGTNGTGLEEPKSEDTGRQSVGSNPDSFSGRYILDHLLPFQRALASELPQINYPVAAFHARTAVKEATAKFVEWKDSKAGNLTLRVIGIAAGTFAFPGLPVLLAGSGLIGEFIEAGWENGPQGMKDLVKSKVRQVIADEFMESAADLASTVLTGDTTLSTTMMGAIESLREAMDQANSVWEEAMQMIEDGGDIAEQVGLREQYDEMVGSALSRLEVGMETAISKVKSVEAVEPLLKAVDSVERFAEEAVSGIWDYFGSNHNSNSNFEITKENFKNPPGWKRASG